MSLGRAVPRWGERLAWIVLAWTLLGLCRCALWWLADPARFSPVTNPHLVALALGRAWLWAALTPCIWLACRRLPWGQGDAARRVAVHLLLGAAVAAADSVILRALVVAVHPDTVLRPFAARYLIDLTPNLFLYLAVCGLGYARRHRELLEACRDHAARVQEHARAARLDALGRQLRPHFLGNALSALAELFHHDAPAARRAVEHVRGLLLGPLASGPVEVPLAVELAALEPFLELQRLRFGPRLALVVHADAYARAAYVPSWLLQPLVENAIRHGLEATGGGRIELHAEVVFGRLTLACIDDGPGPGDGAPREGVGLRTTRLRLTELHGDAAGVRVRRLTAGGGTRVEVWLPAHGAPRPLRLAGPPAATPPEVPRRRSAVAAGALFVGGWVAAGVVWALLRVAANAYLADLLPPVGFARALPASLLQAGLFATVTLAIVAAARHRPPDDRGALSVHAVLALCAAAFLFAVRLLVDDGGRAARVEDLVVSVNGDLSLVLATLAATYAATCLERARRQLGAVARDVLPARRPELEEAALAASLDELAALAASDPERADELAVELGQGLRASLVGAAA